MKDKLGRNWKEAVSSKSRYYPGSIYLERLKKVVKDFSRDIRRLDRESNREPTECESRALPLGNPFGEKIQISVNKKTKHVVQVGHNHLKVPFIVK